MKQSISPDRIISKSNSPFEELGRSKSRQARFHQIYLLASRKRLEDRIIRTSMGRTLEVRSQVLEPI